MKEKYYVSPQPTTTTFISGESITINSTKPNKLAEDIFATGLSTEQPEPTEQEILKKFEELGYEVKNIYDDLILTCIEKNTIIGVDKIRKTYFTREFDVKEYQLLDMQEHQLLTELFKCYKWIE